MILHGLCLPCAIFACRDAAFTLEALRKQEGEEKPRAEDTLSAFASSGWLSVRFCLAHIEIVFSDALVGAIRKHAFRGVHAHAALLSKLLNRKKREPEKKEKQSAEPDKLFPHIYEETVSGKL